MNIFTKTTASVLIGLTALGGGAALAPSLVGAQEVEAPAQVQEDSETTERSERRTERREARSERREARQQSMADLLGVTVEELRTARQDGQSLVEIGAANGVSEQAIIDAIVTEISDRVDAKVADGSIDADRAADKLATLEERVTEKVNNTEPGHRFGLRGMRGNR